MVVALLSVNEGALDEVEDENKKNMAMAAIFFTIPMCISLPYYVIPNVFAVQFVPGNVAMVVA